MICLFNYVCSIKDNELGLFCNIFERLDERSLKKNNYKILIKLIYQINYLISE